MRYFFTILYTFICIGSYSYAQSGIIDSLLSQVELIKTKDSTKVELWGSIAEQYYTSNLYNMKAYSDSSLYLSEELGYSKGIVDSKQKLALYFRLRGNFDTAIHLNKQALQLSRDINYGLGIAKCNLTFANICIQKYELDKGIPYFNEAQKYFLKIGHKRGAAVVALNKAVVHKKKSEYAEALNSYEYSLALLKELDDKHTMAMVYRNIGLLYKNLGNIPLSIENFILALKLSRETRSKLNQTKILNSLGLIYIEQGDLNLARKYLNESLSIAKESGHQNRISTIYCNLARIYAREQNFPLALATYDKAIEAGEEYKDPMGLSQAYQNKGETYFLMGNKSEALSSYFKALDIRSKMDESTFLAESLIKIAQIYLSEKNYQQAETCFLRGLKLAKEENNIKNIRDAALGLSQLKESVKLYKSSLQYYKLYESMADSLDNEANGRKIASQLLGFNHQMELAQIEEEQKKKEQAQELEKSNIQAVRNYFALAFVFTVLLTVVVLLALRRRHIANTNLKKYNEEITQKNSEIEQKSEELIKLGQFKRSMSSMLVHDLKSPLNTILNFPKSNYSRYIEAVNTSGINMLNMVENILDVERFEEAQIVPEIRSFNMYQLVRKIAQETKLLLVEKSIKLHNEIKVNCICKADEELIHRLMLNLLTNAIKFSPIDSMILISCEEDAAKGMLRISVKDQGRGVDDAHKTKIFDKYYQSEARKSGMIRSSGLGLTFCKLVVEAHGGNIGVKDNDGVGSVFHFNIPSGAHDNSTNLAEAQEIIKPASFQFNSDEQEVLKAFQRQLSEIAFYKSSAIRKLIENIPDQSELVIQWKHLLIESVFNGNKFEFRKLVEMITPNSEQS